MTSSMAAMGAMGLMSVRLLVTTLLHGTFTLVIRHLRQNNLTEGYYSVGEYRVDKGVGRSLVVKIEG